MRLLKSKRATISTRLYLWADYGISLPALWNCAYYALAAGVSRVLVGGV